MDIRHLLDEHNANIRIIAKIENQEGIDNIDEILSVADGIMVARGDMGVEIDYAEIPSIQKHLIDHAMQMGKICITATQMLDSMIVNPRPTRAEITDVANAIYDGTGARYAVRRNCRRQVSGRGPESHGNDCRNHRERYQL